MRHWQVVALVLLLCGGVRAETMTEAMNAYRAGDYTVAAQMLRPWAEKGVVEAQYTLGTLYTLGQGVELDYTAGIGWLRRAAEQRHLAAAETLGKIYVSGLGVPRNEAEGVKWFNLATEIAGDDSSDCD